MELFESIDHPKRALVVKFCNLLLGANPKIEAGTKWNSVSFKTSEWFATLNKRALDRVEFIFHFGAKVKEVNVRDQIPNLDGCLEWKSSDRCIFTFRGDEVSDEFANEFRQFVNCWIEHVK